MTSSLVDVLTQSVEIARAAAEETAGGEVGEYIGAEIEDAHSATHLFESGNPGYVGWRWSVTLAAVDLTMPVTISEVTMLPGPDALLAPEWIPWHDRLQAGDLGVGDLILPAADDPRLVPIGLADDDPAGNLIEDDRTRTLSREGRLAAASRWLAGDYGPSSQMAQAAPAPCATCGFYVTLSGPLQAAFGVCANELAPADGHVVHAEYGCGAHSEGLA